MKRSPTSPAPTTSARPRSHGFQRRICETRRAAISQSSLLFRLGAVSPPASHTPAHKLRAPRVHRASSTDRAARDGNPGRPRRRIRPTPARLCPASQRVSMRATSLTAGPRDHGQAEADG
jgi:hypothetical protein